MAPTRKNSEAPIRPWLIIWSMAPLEPRALKLPMPINTKPMWLIEL